MKNLDKIVSVLAIKERHFEESAVDEQPQDRTWYRMTGFGFTV